MPLFHFCPWQETRPALNGKSRFNGVDVDIWSEPTASFLEQVETYQAMLKEVSIRTRIIQVHPQDRWIKTVQGEVLFIPSSSAPRPDADIQFRILYHSKGQINTSRYSNAELDGALHEAITIYDIAKAIPLYLRSRR